MREEGRGAVNVNAHCLRGNNGRRAPTAGLRCWGWLQKSPMIHLKLEQNRVFELSWCYKEQRIKAEIPAEDGHVDTWMFFAVLTTFLLQSCQKMKLGETLKSQ